jgi:hypothetical protein
MGFRVFSVRFSYPHTLKWGYNCLKILDFSINSLIFGIFLNLLWRNLLLALLRSYNGIKFFTVYNVAMWIRTWERALRKWAEKLCRPLSRILRKQRELNIFCTHHYEFVSCSANTSTMNIKILQWLFLFHFKVRYAHQRLHTYRFLLKPRSHKCFGT